MLERRDGVGGGWLDRWDSLCLVAPNFTILLPGKPYDGPDPDGFMPHDEVVNYLKEYAASFRAPVRLGSGVKRLAASNDHLEATIEGGATMYAVGLPWLHSEPSSLFAGIGADAAHIVEHIVRREQSGHGHRAAASSAE